MTFVHLYQVEYWPLYTCNPPALTRIIAVFSRQTLLIGDSIVGSDGTMAELLLLGFNLVSLLCLSWTFQIICYNWLCRDLNDVFAYISCSKL